MSRVLTCFVSYFSSAYCNDGELECVRDAVVVEDAVGLALTLQKMIARLRAMQPGTSPFEFDHLHYQCDYKWIDVQATIVALPCTLPRKIRVGSSQWLAIML